MLNDKLYGGVFMTNSDPEWESDRSKGNLTPAVPAVTRKKRRGKRSPEEKKEDGDDVMDVIPPRPAGPFHDPDLHDLDPTKQREYVERDESAVDPHQPETPTGRTPQERGAR